MPFATHEDYFATMPADISELLKQVQAEVERRVAGSNKCISYNMPAFKKRRTFFYFAAFRKHIGVYPPVTEDQRWFRKPHASAVRRETRHFPSVSHCHWNSLAEWRRLYRIGRTNSARH